MADMDHTFIYKTKLDTIYLYAGIAAAGFAIYCKMNESGISIRNLQLVDYPYSLYIFTFLAIWFLIGAARDIKVYLGGKMSDPRIELTDKEIIFPSLKEGRKYLSYEDVYEYKYDEGDQYDGEIFILSTRQGEEFKFYKNYFQNKTQFYAFIKLIKERSTNLWDKV